MIAADLYEGIRRAAARDADGVRRLLEHLDGDDGYELAPVWLRDLSARLGAVTVLEREGRLLGVACVADLGTSPADGVRAAELAALVVHPAYRRCGLGDSLLDWVEQDSRRLGYGRLVLIQTGRGGYDWFLEVGAETSGASACETQRLGLPALHRSRTCPPGGVSSLVQNRAPPLVIAPPRRQRPGPSSPVPPRAHTPQRDYKALGPAAESQLLPKVCRNSLPPFAQVYSKDLLALTEETDVPAGHRIGF